MSIKVLRALRASYNRTAALRESLHSQSHFHQPLPAPPPLPPTPQSLVSCLRVPDIFNLSRIAADDAMIESLLAWRRIQAWRASRDTAMTAIGDTIVLFRTSVQDAYVARVARMLRRKRGKGTGGAILTRVSGSTLLNASAGMGLAAVVAREHRDPGPESLLRMLSSTSGPQRIGVGWLPAAIRDLLARLCAWFSSAFSVWVMAWYPHVLPCIFVTSAVCFATRPDLASFVAWTKSCAPRVAARKTMFIDKLRAQVAPYVMGLRPPVLDDYGLFSIVTVMDHADYVYVYAGFLSRWCLLGWYNISDDYNFDKIMEHR